MELTHPNSFYWPLGFNQLGHPQPTTQPVGVGCPNSSMGTHPIFGLNSMLNMVNTTATIKCDCTIDTTVFPNTRKEKIPLLFSMILKTLSTKWSWLGCLCHPISIGPLGFKRYRIPYAEHQNALSNNFADVDPFIAVKGRELLVVERTIRWC